MVPTIKLAKAVIDTLPEKHRLSGYHVESLAVRIFQNYDGPKTPKAMLSHFFEKVSSSVKTPIRDSTGQSSHVDEYLGASGSVKRRIASMAIERVSRRMRNADGMRSVDQWRRIIGDSSDVQ